MDEEQKRCEIIEEDLRAALKEMKTYVDVTEEDLKRIYSLARRHAELRVESRVPVSDVMTRSVVTIRYDADFAEAANLLTEHGVSGLPVVDGDGRVIGIVTEADVLAMTGIRKERTFRDFILHLLGDRLARPKQGRRLRDVMSAPAITTEPDADIREVALTMEEKRIKRLPVVDGQGRLIGVISRADIVRRIGET